MMYQARHYASKKHYEAQEVHKLQTGEIVKVPVGIVARAATPGGIYRQIFAMFRKEIAIGVMSESALTIQHT